MCCSDAIWCDGGYTTNLPLADLTDGKAWVVHRYDDALRAALTVADTLLVPVQPRSFDVWALDQVSALVAEAREINEGLRAVAVLNGADAQGADNEAALEMIGDIDGIEVLPTSIVRRKAFPNAAAEGRAVIEQSPRDPKAIDELTALIGAVALTAVLAAFTTFGLVGLAAILLGLGLLLHGATLGLRTQHGEIVDPHDQDRAHDEDDRVARVFVFHGFWRSWPEGARAGEGLWAPRSCRAVASLVSVDFTSSSKRSQSRSAVPIRAMNT